MDYLLYDVHLPAPFCCTESEIMTAGGRGFEIAELNGVRRVGAFDIPTALPQRDVYSMKPAVVRAGPNRIEWRHWPDEAWEQGAPASDCLFNFLKLAHADDVEEFVRFASIHGVLGLTETGLPETFHDTKDVLTVPGEWEWHFESATLWKVYAQSAKSILVLAMALRDENWVDQGATLEAAGLGPEHLVPREEIAHELSLLRQGADFEDLPHPWWTIGSTHPYEVSSVLEQSSSLMLRLYTKWLGLAKIVPSVEWSTGPAKLVLSLNRQFPFRLGNDFRRPSHLPENTLFSVIAAELTAIICSDRSVGRCTRCNALHPSRIKVRTDQPNYCDPCRLAVRRATNRDAARRRYARQKADRARTN